MSAGNPLAPPFLIATPYGNRLKGIWNAFENRRFGVPSRNSSGWLDLKCMAILGKFCTIEKCIYKNNKISKNMQLLRQMLFGLVHIDTGSDLAPLALILGHFTKISPKTYNKYAI